MRRTTTIIETETINNNVLRQSTNTKSIGCCYFFVCPAWRKRNEFVHTYENAFVICTLATDCERALNMDMIHTHDSIYIYTQY